MSADCADAYVILAQHAKRVEDQIDLFQQGVAAGEREETIEHFRELLRLNPNDNQGVRELLLASFLVMGRDEEAQELLDRPEYEDSIMASWAYGRVLVAFRQVGGGSERARQLLSRRSW